MKTILAAIDFSRVTPRVINAAVQLAQALGGRVVALYSVPPPPPIATELASLGAPVVFTPDDLARAAGQHLLRLRRDLKRRGLSIETVCATGFAVTQIVAQAKRLRASYVVIGSHGHTAFYDLVVGSTTSGVLKRAPCPVVVIPATKPGRTKRATRK
jgi:nucleotide-binding universal stress UspA family protein